MFVCNTGSDSISRVNLNSFKEDRRIKLNNISGKVGPHGLCSWKSNIIVANSYSSSIVIIDIMFRDKLEEYYIGGHCNDVAVIGNTAFIVCGECNNVIVFDLESKKVEEEIPCGDFPHSIEVDKDNKFIVIANMNEDSITLVETDKRQVITNIKVGNYPTKAIFTSDSKYIMVCESYLGSDQEGSINVIDLDTLRSLKVIKSGSGPVDIFQDKDMCYVSNFNDESVSCLYIDELEVVKKIKLEGMPRGICKKGRYLYVSDSYKNKLICYDIYNETKKIITVGNEPTDIILI
ncbi:YncE family protein [Clostridium oryzae]